MIELILVYLPPNFWINTANCITADQSLHLNVSLLNSKYNVFNMTICRRISPGLDSIAEVLGQHNVVTIDCRISDKIIGSNSNIHTLQQNGIISYFESYKDYTRYMYRILLNPSIELQRVIHHNKRVLFTRKYVIGVQIRMGGCLADFHEVSQMMTMSQLRALPHTIVTMMRNWNYNSNNTVIYLSTDSSYAERYIRQKLGPEYEIGVSKTFKRSHSRSLGNDEPVKNALVDLYLLADTDGLIVCEGSGFGRVALSITRARHTRIYKVTHSIIPNWNRDSCK